MIRFVESENLRCWCGGRLSPPTLNVWVWCSGRLPPAGVAAC